MVKSKKNIGRYRKILIILIISAIIIGIAFSIQRDQYIFGDEVGDKGCGILYEIREDNWVSIDVSQSFGSPLGSIMQTQNPDLFPNFCVTIGGISSEEAKQHIGERYCFEKWKSRTDTVFCLIKE